jgi:hypothetical protein
MASPRSRRWRPNGGTTKGRPPLHHAPHRLSAQPSTTSDRDHCSIVWQRDLCRTHRRPKRLSSRSTLPVPTTRGCTPAEYPDRTSSFVGIARQRRGPGNDRRRRRARRLLLVGASERPRRGRRHQAPPRPQIKGAGPGMVTYRQERTIAVRPVDENGVKASSVFQSDDRPRDRRSRGLGRYVQSASSEMRGNRAHSTSVVTSPSRPESASRRSTR